MTLPNTSRGQCPPALLAPPNLHRAEYEERKLYFTNPQGERLVGRLVDTGSAEVVILCHGCATGAAGAAQLPCCACVLGQCVGRA